ncbi:phage portal protein [Arthrobacter sp. M-10]|uniref:phage portal protein n=1 Tax=Arthrobacter sp. M-10 TaxID=3233037 RepID=UPI003F9315F1
MQKRTPFRQRLANVISGKSLVPALNPVDGVTYPGMSVGGRLNTYADKPSQLAALTGWVFAANSAIAEPCAAVELKLYRKKKDGDREEVTSGPAMEIMELLDGPNVVHTGEQMRQLHFTYMNIVGESYIFMRDVGGEEFIPARGRLPAALDIFPAHLVQFRLGETYTKSTVSIGSETYPVTAFIRDLNPDPFNPYNGRSIIAASAATLDLEEQMKAWNQQLFANGARPSLIFQTDQPLDDEAYARWKAQFADDHTGSNAAYKPLLIEGGKATPWMLNQQDLDFLESRKFSRDEILAMFKVSPGMIGSVENVNRSNLEAGFYVNAVVNVVPRVRQFVRQINATLVKVYDPTLEIDFVNPVPEDIEAKLRAAEAGVDKWWTKDEVRDMYGEDPLPGGIGEHIIISGKGAPVSLEEVLANDAPVDKPKPQSPEDPDGDGDDDLTEDPSNKSLEGKQSIKKP